MKSRKRAKILEGMKEKSLIAEKNLRDYIQKKYGKTNLSFVGKGKSESWIGEDNEANTSKRVRKKGH